MKKHNIYLLLLPGLLTVVFFLLVPIFNTLMPTFIGKNGATLSPYINFFKDSYYIGILIRTLRIAIITTLICVFLGVPVSYYVSKSKSKTKSILLACTIFPLLTNSVVRSFAWMTILGKNGVINKTFVAIHLFKQPHTLLYTEFAIIVGSVYLFLPLMIVSMVGVMETIENDLIEAAESLGANRLIAFLKVVFPLSVPGIIVGSILVFTGTLSAYTTPQLLGGNKNTVMATLIYQKAMTLSDWNGAAVISTVMIILTVAVMFGINKLASTLNERSA